MRARRIINTPTSFVSGRVRRGQDKLLLCRRLAGKARASSSIRAGAPANDAETAPQGDSCAIFPMTGLGHGLLFLRSRAILRGALTQEIQQRQIEFVGVGPGDVVGA